MHYRALMDYPSSQSALADAMKICAKKIKFFTLSTWGVKPSSFSRSLEPTGLRTD